MSASVPDTSSLKNDLLFVKALIDEENVKYLIPSISTDNIHNGSKVFYHRNTIVAHNGGLVIYNVEKKPVSVELYDMRGRRIFHNTFSSSDDIIKIKTTQFAPGLFIYRMKFGDAAVTRTFLIDK